MPFPPDPAVIAETLTDWMTEPLGCGWQRLVPDAGHVRWAGDIEPPPPDPRREDFGRELRPHEVEQVRDRIRELDLQLDAFGRMWQVAGALRADLSPQARAVRLTYEFGRPVRDDDPVVSLCADRIRPEDERRIRAERDWLASWLDLDALGKP